jgi:hypothetical protein
MRDKGLLSAVEESVTRLGRLNPTESQQRDAVTYEPGQIVEFHKIARGAVRKESKKSRSKAANSGRSYGVKRELSSSERMASKSGCHSTKRASSACSSGKRFTLSIGDRIRFTKNVKHHGQKFLNNELQTVMGFDEGKIRLDKGQICRNGAALHIDQGIAVTSHASQAKTVDQVIVSVPVRAFSQANEAQFYVSMSRARSAMHIFTDSKVALRDAVTRPSERLSFSELVRDAEKERALDLEFASIRPQAARLEESAACGIRR